MPLPESVRDTLRRRLDPLQPEDRELLSLASVVGREFDIVLLHHALDATPETVLARLTAATAIGLVEETPTVGRFRFAHALVHETIYGDLLPAARARLHQRVAEALEALHADRADPPLAELAAHYARAAPLGTAAKAVECSIRAAQQAAAIFAYGDAMAHYERALAALALQAPDERKRLEICLALGNAAVRAARFPQARQAFDQAARRARALGDQHAFVLAALSYAEASPPSGAPDPTVIALLEEALVVVGPADGFSRAHCARHARPGGLLLGPRTERVAQRRGARDGAPDGRPRGALAGAALSPGGAVGAGWRRRAPRLDRGSTRRGGAHRL